MTQNNAITIEIQPDEYWWGGIVRHGDRMPWGRESAYREDLAPVPGEADLNEGQRRGLHLDGNQGCPLLLSNKGRYVWSEDWYAYAFQDGNLTIDERAGEIVQGEAAPKTLRGAYRAACRKFFPPSGRIPHELAFTAPQYNSWIEVHRWPTQEKVLQYAQGVLDADMAPGVMIIDNYWYRNNGHWKWDLEPFPRPKQMIDQLHDQGFLVMLWVSPFVTADTRQCKRLTELGYLLRNARGQIAIQEWWDGHSAALDLSNPDCFAWFQAELDELVDQYGVDGFKFDGGDPYRYKPADRSHAPRSPYGHCEDFGRVGLKYALSEYRACWKLGGQPLMQRVRDKGHTFGVGGYADIIPTSLSQGLVGYPYTCPDMVGGGLLGSFVQDAFKMDQELFVRWAQAATFFPIIQYSFFPSRALDAEHLAHCRRMLDLRTEIGPEMLELARAAATSGEPIMRHMAYVFPGQGFERTLDQYMVGDDILVAPVMQKGAVKRTVKFPPGTWQGDDDSTVDGPCELEVDAPLARLPWYRRG
ncbi:MAG: glycoside hydrolase [Kiritimatiellae bacterium]|nr:glycoside hydrolase [Kiritimatiellia bacterium]